MNFDEIIVTEFFVFTTVLEHMINDNHDFACRSSDSGSRAGAAADFTVKSTEIIFGITQGAGGIAKESGGVRTDVASMRRKGLPPDILRSGTEA